jgi:hypothetical protein
LFGRGSVPPYLPLSFRTRRNSKWENTKTAKAALSRGNRPSKKFLTGLACVTIAAAITLISGAQPNEIVKLTCMVSYGYPLPWVLRYPSAGYLPIVVTSYNCPLFAIDFVAWLIIVLLFHRSVFLMLGRGGR